MNQTQELHIKCSKCNELNKVGVKKCWNCGTKIIQMKNKEKKKRKKRTFRDNIRQLKFNLTSIRANSKFALRVIFRELKYFLPLQDLFILFLMVGVVLVVFLIILIWGLPLALSFIPGDPFDAWIFPRNLPTWPGPDATDLEIQAAINEAGKEFKYLHWNLIRSGGWIFNGTVLRWAAGIIGVGTVVVRLMIKSPIMKYKDKVNTRKDVTYIFGSSRAAEQLLFELVRQYGYEERVSLISDADLLWVRKLKGLIDTYVVEDLREFEKVNLYEIIGFQNASRIMILTESIELNQNILTHIRHIRPDVDIILLSQYAPAFVFSEIVQDENLTIIEDLDMTIQGLVLSLSMDFDFPPTVEIDVPRTYIGSTGDEMSSDLVKQKVIAISRGEELLPTNEILRIGDRVIIYHFTDYFMKLTNRVVTELPLVDKSKLKKKQKKERKNEKVQYIEQSTPISEETTKSTRITDSEVD